MEVQCWGANTYGQLGNAMTGAGGPTPVSVTGVTSALEIAAGFSHVCARTRAGLSCWGYNQDGLLGAGSTADHSATPLTVVAP
jgi:alpha-tubulin suppressor-like RCC1 family protein